jgi:hypothetical protein
LFRGALIEDPAWLRNESFDLDLTDFDASELARLLALADGHTTSIARTRRSANTARSLKTTSRMTLRVQVASTARPSFLLRAPEMAPPDGHREGH